MNKTLLVIFSLLLLTAACDEGGGAEETPTHPVTVRMAADLELPGGGSLVLDHGSLSVAHVTVYGGALDPDDPYLASLSRRLADWLVPAAHAHAGHSHGEAEFEGAMVGGTVVELSIEGAKLGDMTLAEGHYFDGRFDLAPDDSLDGATFVLVGSVDLDGTTYTLDLRCDVTATVAGLELASYVLPDQENEIVLVMQLGALVAALDLPALANESGHVSILTSEDEGAAALKIALKDRLIYPDAATSTSVE